MRDFGNFQLHTDGRVTCRMGHEVRPGDVAAHRHPELDEPPQDALKALEQVSAEVEVKVARDWWQEALEASMAGLKR